jgi:hypothetical protein
MEMTTTDSSELEILRSTFCFHYAPTRQSGWKTRLSWDGTPPTAPLARFETKYGHAIMFAESNSISTRALEELRHAD